MIVVKPGAECLHQLGAFVLFRPQTVWNCSVGRCYRVYLAVSEFPS